MPNCRPNHRHGRDTDNRAGRTPIICCVFRVCHERRTLWLKDERSNPTGSVKDRTGKALLRDYFSRYAEQGQGIVESTSGNMGAALAYQTNLLGIRFRAVVDPNLPPDIKNTMLHYGAELDFVGSPDQSGSFLAARLAKVQELQASEEWVWTNQYQNPAAPRIHYDETGPELQDQVDLRSIGRVYIGVSTGGTIAGLGRFLREHAPHVHIIAVDVVGSTALGGPPGLRTLTGIGSSKASDFSIRGLIDRAQVVSERLAIETCHFLRNTAGIWVGGSTGAIVAAFFNDSNEEGPSLDSLGIIADGGSNYRLTLFNSAWLSRRGFRLGLNRELRPNEVQVIGIPTVLR